MIGMRNDRAMKPFRLVALSTVFILVAAVDIFVDLPSASGSGSAKTLVYAFAVALDVDYLRVPWFHEHSVLGSLRYDYLAWPVYAGSLAALAALLSFTDWSNRRHRGEPVGQL
jgi:hypothetical protein